MSFQQIIYNTSNLLCSSKSFKAGKHFIQVYNIDVFKGTELKMFKTILNTI